MGRGPIDGSKKASPWVQFSVQIQTTIQIAQQPQRLWQHLSHCMDQCMDASQEAPTWVPWLASCRTRLATGGPLHDRVAPTGPEVLAVQGRDILKDDPLDLRMFRRGRGLSRHHSLYLRMVDKEKSLALACVSRTKKQKNMTLESSLCLLAMRCLEMIVRHRQSLPCNPQWVLDGLKLRLDHHRDLWSRATSWNWATIMNWATPDVDGMNRITILMTVNWKIQLLGGDSMCSFEPSSYFLCIRGVRRPL
mmetsp:Transcript_2582/g.6589  ORF Transcript_2582/g.6589 Transcript_2582/m.6589 type:complete len:249 (-) Transcript_2582:15-761(-)